MSQRTLKLQAKKFEEIERIKPYKKRLAGIQYTVLPKVYSGGTDTALLCSTMDIKKGETLWDIGTGTGLVALKAKTKGASYVLATDQSPYAVRNVRLNSKALGIKVDVKTADVFGNIHKRFDVVTFNPPFTDHQALKDYQVCFWDRGNLATKTFFRELHNHLTPEGCAFICWSSFGTRNLLKGLAKQNHLKIEHKKRRRGSHSLYYDVYKLTPV
ncbi:MAG: methyltransferase [bacterium]|nr:methyltransferase [bacterium]